MYVACDTQVFFKDWGIHHRLTSVANPHANSRAEIAVKTVKRMLRDNRSPTGKINTDKFYRALMTYRNTPDRDTGLSPAEVLYGRPLKDFLPSNPTTRNNHPVMSSMWQNLAKHREHALSSRATMDHEKWSKQTKRAATTEGWRPRTRAKSDGELPTQMGQKRHGGRGDATPSVQGSNRWVKGCHCQE